MSVQRRPVPTVIARPNLPHLASRGTLNRRIHFDSRTDPTPVGARSHTVDCYPTVVVAIVAIEKIILAPAVGYKHVQLPVVIEIAPPAPDPVACVCDQIAGR